jgi:hypothetical protein
MDGVASETGCWRACAHIRGLVVAGTFGPYFERFETGTAYRENACFDHGIKRFDDWKEVGVFIMSWLRSLFSGPSEADKKFDATMRLSDEVIEAMRSKKRSSDPFKALIGDMFFQSHPSIDTIVSVYEMYEEGQIWRGPPQ